MLMQLRQNFILEQLRKNGAVTVTALTARLHVSGETIRRDLLALEKKRLLRRVHGGAVPMDAAPAEEKIPSAPARCPGKKVVLILVDGMRPDALLRAKGAKELLAAGAATLEATTVAPSVTLPCHMSLFHSVDPSRHGTTTNLYAPQVRPVAGLFEVLHRSKKRTAMFYSWEELRDVSRPGSLGFSYFFSGGTYGYDRANQVLTEEAIRHISREQPEFTFLYYALPDEVGHKFGWMSAAYLASVQDSVDRIRQVLSSLPEAYTVIVTADHGGHERTHGTQLREDMTVPVIAIGEDLIPGSRLTNINIKDIAPTVAQLLGAEIPEEWEGNSFL